MINFLELSQTPQSILRGVSISARHIMPENKFKDDLKVFKGVLKNV